MKRVLKWVGILAAGALALVLLAAAGGYVLLRNTVPSASGALAIAGLSAPVEVVRDREGVPHVFAKSMEDMLCALGFLHAQDRLWQMELMRRTGQGRLSELFGERTFTHRRVPAHARPLRLCRALACRAAAGGAQQPRGLRPRRQCLHDAQDRPSRAALAPEFLLLRHRPEPWRPADSIVTTKLMALNLSTNLNFELMRLALAAQGLTSAEIDDLMPSDSPIVPPPLPEIAGLYPLQRLPAPNRHAGLGAIEELIGSGASNNWVVSGARTRSGKPLLANDPHLRLAAPAIWYLAHLALEQPGSSAVNVVGATLPGLPLVVLGRSDTLAWGFTNTGPDVQDLFVEKINPDNPKEYLTPDGWRPFAVEPMAIAVKGAGVRTVERRRTRHGPVLPGFFRNLEGLLAPGHVAALQWTALADDDTTVATGMVDAGVRSVDDYMARTRPYVVPMQSMVVADTSGKIGLIAPGRVPVRDPANKIAGRAPVPGWDAAYDWKGYLRFEDLPRVVDPPAGAIGTANAAIVGPDYPHHLTYDWDPEYRQQRVKELIVDRDGHDIASMRAAQADVLSPASPSCRRR